MKAVARFSKVSPEQFAGSWRDIFGTEEGAEDALSAIPLPRRATVGSAGYDFSLPFDLELAPGQTAKIPTGVRAFIREGWVLMILLSFQQRRAYFHQDNQRLKRRKNPLAQGGRLLCTGRFYSVRHNRGRRRRRRARRRLRQHKRFRQMKYTPKSMQDAANTAQDSAASIR